MQISVKVVAGANKEMVEAVSKSRLKVTVKQKAEQGAANKRVVELVARHFKVSAKKVRLIRGHKTPSKILEVGKL